MGKDWDLFQQWDVRGAEGVPEELGELGLLASGRGHQLIERQGQDTAAIDSKAMLDFIPSSKTL